MRISDWSSDVCSSDLHRLAAVRSSSWFVPCEAGRFCGTPSRPPATARRGAGGGGGTAERTARGDQHRQLTPGRRAADRKSVVEGKSVSVRVDLGGRGIIKKNTPNTYQIY